MIIRVSNHATEFGLSPSIMKGVFGNEGALRFLGPTASGREIDANHPPKGKRREVPVTKSMIPRHIWLDHLPDEKSWGHLLFAHQQSDPPPTQSAYW